MCIVTLSVLGGILGTTFGSIGAALGAGTTVATTVGLAAVPATLLPTTTVVTGTTVAAGVAATLAADLAITAAVTGGVLSTVGAVQQAEQQREMAEFQEQQELENARLANKEAEAIKVMGDQEKAQLRQRMLMQKSSARVGYASGGVVLGAGSALDYEADIADAYDLEARNLEYDIKSRQWQKKVAAANAYDQSRMYARQAAYAERSKTTSILSGAFGAAGNLMNTGMSLVSTAGTLKKMGA